MSYKTLVTSDTSLSLFFFLFVIILLGPWVICIALDNRIESLQITQDKLINQDSDLLSIVQRDDQLIQGQDEWLTTLRTDLAEADKIEVSVTPPKAKTVDTFTPGASSK